MSVFSSRNGRSTPSRLCTIFVTLVVLVAIFGGLFLWRTLKADEGQGWQAQPTPVTVMVATPRDVPASLDAVGALTAVQAVTLAPEVAGRVTAIRFAAGQRVRAGDLLVQLFDGAERADRQAAQAKSAFVGLQVARSEELAPTGAEPRELLQQRRAERDQALAAVHQLDARLIQKQVRAPFAGVVGIRKVNLGQYLNAGDAIATLTALDQLYVEFALPQQELTRVTPGASVQVTSDALPGRTFTARVNAVEPQIGTDTRNVTVQALVANPGGALRPGMYVTASLALPPERGVLVVPATAIQTSAQGDSVVVIRGANPRKGGKAEIVPVQAGRRIDNDVIVTGLEPGDVVVSEGQLRVRPGAELTVAQAARTRRN